MAEVSWSGTAALNGNSGFLLRSIRAAATIETKQPLMVLALANKASAEEQPWSRLSLPQVLFYLQ
ncbi:MAG TPA: hypothetical protein VKP67_24475 [Xanthobacteraceae bacterium]|nr:hypothetical protein [Xanthobacteraceae bacterium]